MHRFLRGARRVLLSAVVLSALSACGGGGGGDGGAPAPVTPVATNKPPVASILGSGDVRAAAAGGIGLGVTLGGVVRLDASGSTDPENDALSFEWSLVAKPDGSAVTLADTKAKTLQFSPDALGTYTVALKLNDGRGGQTTQQLSIAVDNRPPTGNVVVEPIFTAVPGQAETQSVSVGGAALFNAEGSTDPDGHPVSIRFELLSRPGGSAANLVTDGKRARLDIDMVGTYRVKVVGSDGRASFETVYPITADNRAPVPSITVQPTFTAVPVQNPSQHITVGGSVLVDATTSTDPDGDTVSVFFEMQERPVTSYASVVQTGKQGRFVADRDGVYRVKVRGFDGRGASFDSIHVFVADNHAPMPVLVNTVIVSDNVTTGTTVNGTLGYVTQLDSSSSTDPDSNLTTRGWELVSRPAGSAAALSSTSGVATNLAPDVMGDYLVKLTVTDALGARGTQLTTVHVANRQPVAQILTNATPQSLPTAPSLRVPRNTQLTLRGSSSFDADGDAITLRWSIDSKPAGSTAALSSTSAADPLITVDTDGVFVFRLRVTDPAGAFSERTIAVNVGREPPVPVLDRGRLTLIAGETARASAALSFDRDGDALTYRWTLDARPAGSAAAITSPNQAALSFVPDVAGTYAATVTVSDGLYSASASVDIRVLSSLATSVPLNFAPIKTRYSAGLDKLVVLATNPDTLRIVDPFTGNIESVVLPTVGKTVSLSAQGRLAAVLHEGAVSLVDLQTATLIRTSATTGRQVEVMVGDDGFIMLPGSTAGFNDPLMTVLNGRTGDVVPQNVTRIGYGSSGGVYVSKLNKGITFANCCTPADLAYFVIDPVTHQITATGDSPYHGDYLMDTPEFMTESQDYVFTWTANYFRTSDLRYGGKITGLTWGILGLSNFAATEETLIIDSHGGAYPSSYRRYTGPLFMPDTTLALPQIGGRASYAMSVFHSTTGRHVVLVQVGSPTPGDTGVSYAVITR